MSSAYPPGQPPEPQQAPSGGLAGGLQQQPDTGMGGGQMTSTMQMLQQGMQRTDEEGKPNPVLKKKTTNMVTGATTFEGGEGSDKFFQAIIEKAQKYDATVQSFMQQRQRDVARLQQEEEQLRKAPLLNVLTNLAGSMASTKNMPDWVQAAGKASMALNPTPDALRAQRYGAEEGLMGAIQQSQRSLMEQYKIASDVKGQSLEMKRRAEEAKIVEAQLKESRLLSRNGIPISYEAFRSNAEARGIPAEKIAGLYEAHKAEAKAALEGAVKKEDIKTEAKEKYGTFKLGLDKELGAFKGRISLGNRLAGIEKSFQNSISDGAIGAKVKVHQLDKAIDEAAASSKELRVMGPAVEKELAGASKTNQYLNTTQHMLEQPEFAQVQGPLFSYNPKTGEVKFNEQAGLPKQFKGIDRTLVESQISHEIPRLLGLMLNGQAGGASLLRTDAGKQLVKDMGITGAIRADQALAILKIIRDTNNNNVAAAMRSKPNAPWGKLSDLTGASDPHNADFFIDRKDFTGGPIQPFPDPFAGATGTAPAAPSQVVPTKKYPWEK